MAKCQRLAFEEAEERAKESDGIDEVIHLQDKLELATTESITEYVENAESLGTVRLKHRVLHHFTVEVGADVIVGPEPVSEEGWSNPFYVYSPNDRVITRVAYRF